MSKVFLPREKVNQKQLTITCINAKDNGADIFKMFLTPGLHKSSRAKCHEGETPIVDSWDKYLAPYLDQNPEYESVGNINPKAMSREARWVLLSRSLALDLR